MRGILWFVAISFALAWSLWEALIQSGVSVLSWQFQLYGLPAAFAPAIAAIIVRRWISHEGFSDAGLGPKPRKWRYYLLAWLLPLPIVAAIVAQAHLFAVAEPDFGLSRPGWTAGWIIVPQVMLMAIAATPLLWGEEFGWRGYLQQRILHNRPVAAAVVTGTIWAVWHFPVTLRGYNYPDHPVLGSLLFVPITIMLSYILGWFMRRTGSIWVCSLGHAATNAIGGGLTTIWFAGAASPIVASYGGMLAVAPLMIVCACLYWLTDRQPQFPISNHLGFESQ